MTQITAHPVEIHEFLEYVSKALSIMGEQHPHPYAIGNEGIVNVNSRHLYGMQQLAFCMSYVMILLAEIQELN